MTVSSDKRLCIFWLLVWLISHRANEHDGTFRTGIATTGRHNSDTRALVLHKNVMSDTFRMSRGQGDSLMAGW